MNNKQQLQQGISILYDMELNNYLTTRGIRRLNYEINRLGHAQRINKPSSPSGLPPLDVDGKNAEGEWAILGVVGMIIGIIVGFISAESFWKIVYAFFDGIAGMIIGSIIGFIVQVIHEGAIAKDLSQQRWQEYNNAMDDYNKKIHNDSIRVRNENAQKQVLIDQRSILQNKLEKSKKTLQKFYNIMNIDGNYRNIVPIGYMNEFIRLGIATHLTGSDGLYYLVRKELRMDQMQASLDDISSKLDQIIDNQHEIYSQLITMNNKCEEMIQATLQSSANINSRLDSINSNTAITAYNSERILREQRYQNFFITWEAMSK